MKDKLIDAIPFVFVIALIVLAGMQYFQARDDANQAKGAYYQQINRGE